VFILIALFKYLAFILFHDYDYIMESTISTKNMTSIPQAIVRKLGMKPGWKLDWQTGPAPDEILVKVIPDRGERGRRLLGKGSRLSPNRSAVDELVAERETERKAEE